MTGFIISNFIMSGWVIQVIVRVWTLLLKYDEGMIHAGQFNKRRFGV